MITLEKILTDLKGESLNEIIGGTYNPCAPTTCATTPSCHTTPTCGEKPKKGKKGKKGRGRGRRNFC